MRQLEELLQHCVVKIVSNRGGWGTGFFVAPNQILTCAHVVRALQMRAIAGGNRARLNVQASQEAVGYCLRQSRCDRG